jgi:hypothetical protein
MALPADEAAHGPTCGLGFEADRAVAVRGDCGFVECHEIDLGGPVHDQGELVVRRGAPLGGSFRSDGLDHVLHVRPTTTFSQGFERDATSKTLEKA